MNKKKKIQISNEEKHKFECRKKCNSLKQVGKGWMATIKNKSQEIQRAKSKAKLWWH